MPRKYFVPALAAASLVTVIQRILAVYRQTQVEA
jgi:hypothetical protein